MSERSHLKDENVVQSQINFKYKTKLNGISEPCEFYCFTCNQPRISRIEYSYSKATFIWCYILCFCTIILGLVPFCMQKCSSKTHYCPICDKITHFELFQILKNFSVQTLIKSQQRVCGSGKLIVFV